MCCTYALAYSMSPIWITHQEYFPPLPHSWTDFLIETFQIHSTEEAASFEGKIGLTIFTFPALAIYLGLRRLKMRLAR